MYGAGFFGFQHSRLAAHHIQHETALEVVLGGCGGFSGGC